MSSDVVQIQIQQSVTAGCNSFVSLVALTMVGQIIRGQTGFFDGQRTKRGCVTMMMAMMFSSASAYPDDVTNVFRGSGQANYSNEYNGGSGVIHRENPDGSHTIINDCLFHDPTKTSSPELTPPISTGSPYHLTNTSDQSGPHEVVGAFSLLSYLASFPPPSTTFKATDASAPRPTPLPAMVHVTFQAQKMTGGQAQKMTGGQAQKMTVRQELHLYYDYKNQRMMLIALPYKPCDESVDNDEFPKDAVWMYSIPKHMWTFTHFPQTCVKYVGYDTFPPPDVLKDAKYVGKSPCASCGGLCNVWELSAGSVNPRPFLLYKETVDTKIPVVFTYWGIEFLVVGWRPNETLSPSSWTLPPYCPKGLQYGEPVFS